MSRDRIVAIVWLAAGVFFAIAAIGGAKVAAFAAIACGWFAGRNREKDNSTEG